MARLRLPLIAAALILTFVVPGRALAAKKLEIALQDDHVLVNRIYYDRDKALEQAAKLQVSWIRVNVLWADVVNGSKRRKRPKHVRYKLTRFDNLINDVAPQGIKVQLVLTGLAPAWAAGNHKRGPFKPNSRLFDDFVEAAAKHFKGRVSRYSIWNEPNHFAWLAPRRTAARQYRTLYKRGYAAIKRVDPTAQVLIGELAPYSSKPGRATPPLQFLRQLTCVNRRYKRVRKCTLFADGFAHHPYEYFHAPTYRFPGRDNVTMRGLPKLERALTRLAKVKALRTPAKKPLDLYLTEYGYFARGKYKIPERKRAKWLRQAFEIAQRDKRVKQMLQYLLIQPDKVHAFFDTSLIGRRGKPSLTYRKLVSWVAKATKAGKIAVPQPPAPPGGGGTGQPPQQPPPGGGPTCPIPAVPVCP